MAHPRRRGSLAGALTVAALVQLLGAQVLGAGTITGRVNVQQKGGRLLAQVEGVLVFVDGIRAHTEPTQVSVEMKNKKFVPHLVAVPVGSSVRFPNLDPIHHNAFSVSGPNRFDLELYKKPQSRAVSFDFPGVVRVFCNIHPQMSAIVLVRDNPHFVWVRPDGSFTLTGVPAGRHTLKAWYAQAGETSTDVIVPADGEVRVALALDASHYRPARHKNKYGRDYHPEEHY